VSDATVSYIDGIISPSIVSKAMATSLILVPVKVPASVAHLPLTVYVPADNVETVLYTTLTEPLSATLANFRVITGESTPLISIAKSPTAPAKLLLVVIDINAAI
jgi:hypothetical protein